MTSVYLSYILAPTSTWLRNLLHLQADKCEMVMPCSNHEHPRADSSIARKWHDVSVGFCFVGGVQYIAFREA